MKTEISRQNSSAMDELQKGDFIMFPDYKYKFIEEDRTIPRRMILIKFNFMEMYARDPSRIIVASLGTVFLYPACLDYPPLVGSDKSGSPFYCEKKDNNLNFSFFSSRDEGFINRGEVYIGLPSILGILKVIPRYSPHEASLRAVHGVYM